MQAIQIHGGTPLNGIIPISGSKNAALPLMTLCLLTNERFVLRNVPDLADINTMKSLLEQHGASIKTLEDKNSYELKVENLISSEAPYDLVRKMRASVLVLGPLLAKYGKAKVSLPGGCAIGTRPIDFHLKALETLGAEINLKSGYVEAKVPKHQGRLRGGHIVFPSITVGGTENAMMAASIAKGNTIIENAAREPEILDLANCLNLMGAKISGAGSSVIRIEGVEGLSGVNYSVLPDRIETGTYAIAAAITRGNLKLINTDPNLLEAVITALRISGVDIEVSDRSIDIATSRKIKGVDIQTEPYPGFPTDMQAQWMALMATADGAAMLTETIFENRFMHVPELVRFGANINVHGKSAIIRGSRDLSGAPVMATDLRASVSLVLLGLATHGTTIINRVYHLDRGYDGLEKKLESCGASIERISIK